jgi:hypothetical protein
VDGASSLTRTTRGAPPSSGRIHASRRHARLRSAPDEISGVAHHAGPGEPGYGEPRFAVTVVRSPARPLTW